MQSIASLMSIGSITTTDVGNLDDFEDEYDLDKSETTSKISEITSQLGLLAKSATLDTVSSSIIGKCLFNLREYKCLMHVSLLFFELCF